MATPLKILFADDDLKYSLLLKRFLEKEGYDVAYTGNGMMVLEQFPVVKPDLVLLDINMPGLNGFEVAEKIRENDRHVLIFFLSDRSDKNDRLKGFSLKGNDYLAKPFYPEELLARIKERFEVNPDVKVEEEIYHFANTVFDYSTNEIRTGNSKTLVTSRQAEIPTPSSVTVSSISLSFRITTTRILTPEPEYLIAFSIRLLRILAICTGSAVTNGRSGGKAVEKATCFPDGI